MRNELFLDFAAHLDRVLSTHKPADWSLARWCDEADLDVRKVRRWRGGENLPTKEHWESFKAALRKLSSAKDRVDADLKELDVYWADASRARLEAQTRQMPRIARAIAKQDGSVLDGPRELIEPARTSVAREMRSAPFRIPDLPAQQIQGRVKVLNRVCGLLRLDDARARDVRPVALWGMPGVGKTTVANALVHMPDIDLRFPDGIVWITVGPQPATRALLNAVGTDFGVDLNAEIDVEACTERLRRSLYSRRTLFVVDDVWEPEHGLVFLLAGPFGRTVVTTRESLVAFPLATGARSIRVRELQPAAALALLAELAPDAVARDRAGAETLCRKLEFLPLAVKLAGNFLAQEAGVPARTDWLIGELTDRRRARLSLTSVGSRPGLDPDTPASLEAIISLSVERLDAIDRKRFALLSTFGGEPLFWVIPHAAEIWECSHEEAAATTSRLIQRGLIENRRDEYWMHAVLCDYAAELIARLGE
jgi:hypothetical protein